MDRKHLFFEDVKEGSEMPQFRKEKLTRRDICLFAGASGDFSPNHTDDVFAHRVGHERVFAHGRLSAGYLTHAVTDWLGDGHLRRFKVRFGDRVWPGDTLTCKGVVTKKYQEENEKRVDCDVWVENDRGDKVTIGWVTAALPSKS